MSDILRPILASFLRHALTAGGALLVSDGLATQSDANSLIGAGMILGGIGWSWWQKYGEAKIVAALTPTAGGTPVQAQAKKA